MAASTSSSLLAKARKIVPSAMPAASAICRVVTSRPCSRSRRSVTSTNEVRRSSGDIGRARGGMALTLRQE